MSRQYPQEMSIIDKMTMGATMGALLGATTGLIFGGTTVLKYGPGPEGYIRTIAKYIGGSMPPLMIFFSIGSVIRSEDQERNRRIARAYYMSKLNRK